MIFNRGDFNSFKSSQSQVSLNESIRKTRYFSATKPHSGTTVFVSHKHDELDLGELDINQSKLYYVKYGKTYKAARVG